MMTLAEAFELDTNVLKQFYATQLVSHGYDVLALEVCYYAGQNADEGKHNKFQSRCVFGEIDGCSVVHFARSLIISYTLIA